MNCEYFTYRSLIFHFLLLYGHYKNRIGLSPMNNMHNNLHIPHLPALIAAALIFAAFWGPLGVMAARIAGY
jgi:hypothetical protein